MAGSRARAAAAQWLAGSAGRLAGWPGAKSAVYDCPVAIAVRAVMTRPTTTPTEMPTSPRAKYRNDTRAENSPNVSSSTELTAATEPAKMPDANHTEVTFADRPLFLFSDNVVTTRNTRSRQQTRQMTSSSPGFDRSSTATAELTDLRISEELTTRASSGYNEGPIGNGLFGGTSRQLAETSSMLAALESISFENYTDNVNFTESATDRPWLMDENHNNSSPPTRPLEDVDAIRVENLSTRSTEMIAHGTSYGESEVVQRLYQTTRHALNDDHQMKTV